MSESPTSRPRDSLAWRDLLGLVTFLLLAAEIGFMIWLAAPLLVR